MNIGWLVLALVGQHWLDAKPNQRTAPTEAGDRMTTDAMVTGDAVRPPTRAEIEEALTNLAIHASRQPYVIARMLCDKPTSWDKAHRLMDEPLDAWLAARA